MPGYINPDKIPPVGGYTWVPAGPPSGDAQASRGFKQPVNLYGEIRNDLPFDTKTNIGTITASFSGNKFTEDGSENYPILNSFRFLQRESSYKHLPPSTFLGMDNQFTYDFSFKTKTAISSIQIEYQLGISLSDQFLENLAVDEETKALVKSSVANGVVDQNLKLDNILGCSLLIDSVEYPTNSLSKLPKEIPITTIYTGTKQQFIDSSAQYVNRIIRLGQNEFSITDFPSILKATIKSKTNQGSLVLKINKIKFLSPKRVNLDIDQVPASGISYAFPILFKVSSGITSSSIIPSGFRNRGTVNVKVYSRDYLSSSPGFAHSINLRFLIAGFGLVNIDPFSLLSGSGFNLTAGLSYYWFLGLWPERRNIKLKLSSYKSITSNDRVVQIFQQSTKDTKIISLQKIESSSSPLSSSNWVDVENSERNLKYTTFDKNNYNYDNNPFNTEFVKGYTKPFNFVDGSSSNNTWYRIKKQKYDSSIVFSDPFKGDHHGEIVPFLLIDNDISGDSAEYTRQPYDSGDIKNDAPIALFSSTETYNPRTLELNKDSFKIILEANKKDPNNWVNLQLYFRFWFVPENVDTNEIFRYQDTHEIRFVNSSNGTVIEIGKPRDYSEMMISPGIINERQKINLVRYINNSTAFSNGYLFFPTSSITSWKLMMGVYTVTTTTSSNPGINRFYQDYPDVTLYINSDGLVETPFYVISSATTTSGILKASKLPQFNSITKKDYSTTLSLRNCLTGNRIVSGSIEYDKIATFPSNTYIDNSFKNLLNIKTNTDITNYNLLAPSASVPLSSVSGEYSEKKFKVIDFCTDGPLLSRGQIDVGTWTIESLFTIFGNFINYRYRIEILIVDYSGQLVNTVHKSPVLFSTDDKYQFDILVPFILPEGNCQIVTRIYFYPFSTTGEPSSGKITIEKFDINSHTIKINEINQNDFSGGSIAFYEDLSLLPANSIENNDFWFIAANDLLEGTQPVLSDSQGEFTIQGCLYSPSWLLSLPENTDVETFTYGLGTNPILFRTIPGKSVDAEIGVSAVENKFNNSVSVVHTSSKVVNKPTEILTSDDDKHNLVRQKLIQKNGKILSGSNPSIITSNTNENSDGSNHFILIENNDTTGTTTNLAGNVSSNNPDRWAYYNGEVNKDFLDSTIKFLKGLKNNSYVTSSFTPEIYVAGIAQPGSVIVKVIPLNFNEFSYNTSKSVLVDGPNVDYPDLFPNLVITDINTDKAANTYPAICINSQRNAIVLYTMISSPSVVRARLINNLKSTERYEVINLSFYTGSTTSEPITGLSCVYDFKRNVIHLCFYLNNSIYYYNLENIVPSQSYFTNHKKFHFVAGDTTSSNIILSTLVNRKKVFIDSSQSLVEIVPKQRPGIYLSNKSNEDGFVYIWYKNSSGDLVRKKISPYASTSEPVVFSSLTS